MKVTSLEKMEAIVAKNKNLSWNGWTVLESLPNATAWTKPNGAFINGSWHIQNRFEPTERGWDIPGRFVR
jgi:hypothetical protein